MAVAEWQQRQEEERRRLLYVAMTRAESWLIVAAAGDTGEGLDSWHAMVAEGAGRTALTRQDLPIEGVGTGCACLGATGRQRPKAQPPMRPCRSRRRTGRCAWPRPRLIS